MEPLRKLVSILLLAVFGLPFASPAFALGRSAESGVRACCRRGGAHHCMENMDMGTMSEAATGSNASGPMWTSPPAKCPFAPASTVAIHHELANPSTSAAIFAAIVSHPCGSPQTESKWRIAQIRSRQKRGPPAISL